MIIASILLIISSTANAVATWISYCNERKRDNEMRRLVSLSAEIATKLKKHFGDAVAFQEKMAADLVRKSFSKEDKFNELIAENQNLIESIKQLINAKS